VLLLLGEGDQAQPPLVATGGSDAGAESGDGRLVLEAGPGHRAGGRVSKPNADLIQRRKARALGSAPVCRRQHHGARRPDL